MATAKKSAKKTSRSYSASDAVDTQLERYRSMRDFSVTAEPSGTTKAKKHATREALPFVIQKHAASHLHYDFRLAWNGVLKSWAVAKGPSYFPGDRRLAVQVEDHPMEYGGFEGIIPEGQYGGGTVMLWDQGTWEPQAGHTDVDAGLREGSLKFTLHGTKMKGNWTLVRMGGKAANERKPNWLLIKEHDGLERGDKDKCITEESPNSVVTGRTLDDIAQSKDHVWNSKDTANPRQTAWFRQESKTPEVSKKQETRQAASLAHASKEALPKFIPPQLATQGDKAPATDGWLHELKLDGYRIQARKEGSKVQLLTRTGLDWTHRMRPIADAIATLPTQSCLLDGEVVVLLEDGTTSFAELQAAFQEGLKKPLTYFVFDLLHLDGHDLRDLPLVERKNLLANLIQKAPEPIRLSEHIETSGDAVFNKACDLHAEGILSKRASSRYSSGRSADWIKLKCIHEQEFVVAGFTLPSKGHAGIHGVGALLLAYYTDDGHLVYAGRTGTGFTQKTHRLLRTQLDALRQAKASLTNAPAEARRGAIWVKPTLVVQVHFATWTADHLVRQAAFLGVREDKLAREVRLESPAPKSRARGKQAAHKVSTPIAAKVVATQEHAPVRLTHPDKILDAESGLTKQQLADYYWAIAPAMLPHIAGRPLSIVRCPDGSTKPCFFQKHTNTMLPSDIGSVDVPDKKTGAIEPYITLSTPEALAGLAQIGVLEVHPWGSRNDDLEHPDRIIIDLDPDDAISWTTLAEAATEVRQKFKKLGLESFLKTTGGKGLHIVVPIQPEQDWAAIKQFAHSFVLEMEKSNSSLYLSKMSKAARKGRIYLDYLRNERGATAVAPFSPRARAGTTVSLPLAWTDLKLPNRPLFHVSDFATWKARIAKDPWKKMPLLQQKLTLAEAR